MQALAIKKGMTGSMTEGAGAGQTQTSDAHGQERRWALVAAVRDVGDSRRQRVLSYLAKNLNVVTVPVRISAIRSCLNLIRTISPRKALWRDRSKRNAYYFRAASLALSDSIGMTPNGAYDVIFLFEALYGPGLGSRTKKPYLIYEDSTSALALRTWPDWVPDTARSRAYQELESE